MCLSMSECERQAQSTMVDQYDVNVCPTPRSLSCVLFKLSALSLSQSDSLIVVVVVPLQSAANVNVGSENEIENITRKNNRKLL